VPESRSLEIQSVLYGNSADDIMRAAQSASNSVRYARERGLVSGWQLRLGDSSAKPVLSSRALYDVESVVASAGGVVEYTVFGANLGSAGGHNVLAAAGDSDLMLILNPDARMSPDAVSVLAQSVVGDVGIAEARQVPLEHPKEFTARTGDTSWASTACALTTRAVFELVDGFDADTFFLYCDDVDYSWRVRLAGHRVVFAPAASVFHDKRLTASADWPASDAEIYYTDEAAILLAYKYSRQDLVRALAGSYRRRPTPVHLKVLAEFDARKRSGSLPKPIDADHKVAKFIKDRYAQHRY
jgi:GT2 family glycosyltransferase